MAADVSVGNPARRIPAAVRREVVARDGMVCRSCQRTVRHRKAGEPYSPDHIHLDHLIEWAAGGDNSPGNLIVSCADCNLRRPKPLLVNRTPRIGLDYRNGTYYWNPPTFRPPRKIRTVRDGFSIRWVCDYLSVTPGTVVHCILSGMFSASAGAGPIVVGLDRGLLSGVERYEAARIKAAERERQEEEWREMARRKDREAARSNLDPERLNYWRAVIAEGRAARKAAKA